MRDSFVKSGDQDSAGSARRVSDWGAFVSVRAATPESRQAFFARPPLSRALHADKLDRCPSAIGQVAIWPKLNKKLAKRYVKQGKLPRAAALEFSLDANRPLGGAGGGVGKGGGG